MLYGFSWSNGNVERSGESKDRDDLINCSSRDKKVPCEAVKIDVAMLISLAGLEAGGCK
jgi:hypothetical protein